MLMKQTIWYISKYVVPPYAAKVSTRGFFLLKEFAALGYKAVLITSNSNHLANVPPLKGQIEHECVEGVDVCWLKTRGYTGPRSIGRILSWFDFEWKLFKFRKNLASKPDVIIVSSLSLLTIVNGFLLKKIYQCKLVFEIRDIWPLILMETGGFSKYNPFIVFLAFVEKFGYHVSDLIVGTMPNLIEHVKNVAPNSKAPVICIPHGLNLEQGFDAPLISIDYLNKYVPSEKFIICHAGTIGADNALDVFFECAVQMQSNSSVHFLLVGEGYLKNEYQNKYGLLPNLTFAPRVEKNMVQSVLSSVDLLYFAVHKSPVLKYGQSLNKIIDYMLSGKPIVASFSGYPSMINEAECGSYVQAGDVHALKKEIERYASMTSEERQSIGLKGRDWVVANRGFDKLAKQYISKISSIEGP
jgi:glycosyltransferase involved in cell wall biosynthesis